MPPLFKNYAPTFKQLVKQLVTAEILLATAEHDGVCTCVRAGESVASVESVVIYNNVYIIMYVYKTNN